MWFVLINDATLFVPFQNGHQMSLFWQICGVSRLLFLQVSVINCVKEISCKSAEAQLVSLTF